MHVSVGTFNLNNLFSRYNFRAEIDAIRNRQTEVDSNVTYTFGETSVYRERTYRGQLVQGKPDDETNAIAQRIREMDVDVLAVQEVEDVDTLRAFNRERLNNLYRYSVLIEGNDTRMIDLGVLSKLPLGAVTSWQAAVHPEDPGRPVFGRDLLEVEVYNASRRKRLFTLFNNHLKSNHVDWRESDPAHAHAANHRRRHRQADVVAQIVKARTRPDSSFVILGDMNDRPDSDHLHPFVADSELQLSNALSRPVETRPAKDDDPPPPTAAWTHRYKPSGRPAEYALYDQIWLSPRLAARQRGAWIDRRTKHGGDGSDHDPAWVMVDV